MPISDMIFRAEWPSSKEPFFGVGLLRDRKFGNVAAVVQPNNNAAVLKHYTGIPDTKVVTPHGGASVSPSKKKFGAASLWLVANRMQYLSVLPVADFILGTDDAEIIAQVFPTTVGVEQVLCSSGNDANCYELRVAANNKIEFEIKGLTTLTSTTTLSANAADFAFVAVTRRNHVFRLMVNGKIEATYTASSSLSLTATLFYIGAKKNPSIDDQLAYFDGYIDAFRVVSGQAVYYQEAVSASATTVGFTTSGNQFVDAAGNNVRFTGLNWSGAEHEDLIVGGLWARNWKLQLNQMKQLGFNLIRWPICDDLVRSTKTNYTSVNFGLNPDVQGKTPLQVLKMMLDYCKSIGIYVWLDHHRCTAGGGPSGGESGTMRTGLWYDSRYSENDMISNWQQLALLFADNEFVIGADLHNEPNGDTRWGTTSNPARDWRAAAIRIANAIHAVNPNWLVIAEGTEWSNVYGGDTTNYDWWGGNLRDARDPSRRFTVTRQNKAAYSVHSYGTSVATPGWFNEAGYPTNLKDHYSESWGWLISQRVSPVIIGEMGGQFTQTKDQQYIDTLIRYMNGDFNLNGGTVLLPGEHGVSYTMWTWSPTSGDTGGLVDSATWSVVDENKMKYYRRALFTGQITPKVTGGSGGPATPTSAPSNITGTILLLNFDTGISDLVDLIRGAPLIKVGSPTLVPYFDRKGGAAIVQSQGNYYKIPYSSKLDLGSQTFVAEWKGLFSTAAKTDVIFAQADDGASNSQIYVAKTSGNKLEVSVWLADGTKVQTIGTSNLLTGTEYHILVTRTGNTLSAYINDVREFTATVAQALHTSTYPWSIGHYDGATANSDLAGRTVSFRLTVADDRGLSGASISGKRDTVFAMRG